MSEELTSSGGQKESPPFPNPGNSNKPFGNHGCGGRSLPSEPSRGGGVRVGGCGVLWLAESEGDVKHRMLVF